MRGILGQGVVILRRLITGCEEKLLNCEPREGHPCLSHTWLRRLSRISERWDRVAGISARKFDGEQKSRTLGDWVEGVPGRSVFRNFDVGGG